MSVHNLPPCGARGQVLGVNHSLQLQLQLFSCDHAILESNWGRNVLPEDVLGFSGGSVLGEFWASKPILFIICPPSSYRTQSTKPRESLLKQMEDVLCASLALIKEQSWH